MTRRLVLPLVFIATALVAAEQTQQMQVPPRPPSMGGTGRDPGLTQPQPKGTGVISGVVTSADGGRVMRRAQVRLQGTTTPFSKVTTTDDRGNFEFKELPAGDFTLRTSKAGYLESIYGQKKPGSGRPGTPISLKDGQQIDKLTVSIAKGGVLTGTIVDDLNEPVFGTQVRALRYAMRGGERTLVAAGTATTDDRGVYRISVLGPGDYIVMATPRADSVATDDVRAALEEMAARGGAGDLAFAAPPVGGGGGGAMSFTMGSPLGGASSDPGPSSGYAPVFFPSTTLSTTATTVTLGPAEEKVGLDIQLQLVPLGMITGTVMGDPRAMAQTTIQLSDANTGLPGLTAKTARPDAQGRFTFNGVAPGQYNITAKSGGNMTIMSDGGNGNVTVMMTRAVAATGPGGSPVEVAPAPAMWAKAEVAVDGRSKTDVALVLQPGMTVSGRVAFDGTGEPPQDLTAIRVLLASGSANGLISGSSNARVDAEGRFRITDVAPGKYRFSAPAPRGWRPKSVDADNRDALDFMLEVKPNEDLTNVTVTYTNKPAELSGVLQDSSGQPTSDYTIVLFSADQRYWTPQSRRIVSARPTTEGKYAFRDLPAGEYRLAALEDVEPESWFDPNFLRTLIGASTSVTIIEGEKKTQDIKVNR